MTRLTEELKSLLTGKTVGATCSTNTRAEHENESNLIGSEFLSENLRDLEQIKARRSVSSHGYKDPGVHHPPRSQVKKDPEEAMTRDMYQGVDYNIKKGFINTAVGQRAPPLRQMNDEECKANVAGFVLAQMYSLRKGTELFGEKAEQATMTELAQIDNFETYRSLHKYELSEQDRRNALESMIKVTEKRADEGHRKIKSRMVADGSKQRSYKGYEKSDGSSPIAWTDSVIMTGVIVAHEHRNIAVVDVENAFL